MQDLNDMLYFAEVVDRGGFAAASRALGIPKSRLSRRVAELEARLGVRLMQRTTRKLSLTDTGELYYRHCAAIRDEAQRAGEAVAHVQAEPRGTIRLVCPVTLAQTVIGHLLPGFLAAYPQVKVDMQVSNRVVDLVEEGVDLALRVRHTLADSGSLVVKQFGRTPTALVASPGQLLRQGQPTRPQELSWLDTVAMSAVDGRATLQLLGPGGAQFTFQHYPRYIADDLLTLQLAVLAGIGAGYLPQYMCETELRDGRLVPVLPDWSLPPGLFHAVFPSRRGLVPAVRALLDYLTEHVPMCNEVYELLADRS
ncbi:MAG TPA: LysR substrate-binding domain-containing protein [Chitinolyticbacter sp.]|nr:LysR substrate-binding domain-containing protein [Chitinolyticbacter sp.]